MLRSELCVTQNAGPRKSDRCSVFGGGPWPPTHGTQCKLMFFSRRGLFYNSFDPYVPDLHSFVNETSNCFIDDTVLFNFEKSC